MKTTSICLLSATLLVTACSTTPKPSETTDNLTASRQLPEAEMQGFGESSDRGELINMSHPDGLGDQRVLYFGFDDDKLTEEGQAQVVEHAKYLVANPDVTLRLEGHADERGSREYNMALGERRARNVQRELYLRGVKDGQLTLVSYGEERPAILGAQRESSFAKNRRVEFNYRSGTLAGAPLSYERPVSADEAMTASRPRVN